MNARLQAAAERRAAAEMERDNHQRRAAAELALEQRSGRAAIRDAAVEYALADGEQVSRAAYQRNAAELLKFAERQKALAD
jgi:hypothetical protein